MFLSTIGDLWGGGLVVYKLKNFKNYFGRVAYEDESTVVDDISHQVVTETSFDSSVASIAPLNLSCGELTDAVVIGLDDGSIQLVTLREVSANSHQSQMQVFIYFVNFMYIYIYKSKYLFFLRQTIRRIKVKWWLTI